MTREESWQATGATLALLRQVAGLGYTVSVFRFPSSMPGTMPATVEMHAIDLRDVTNEESRTRAGPQRASTKPRAGV